MRVQGLSKAESDRCPAKTPFYESVRVKKEDSASLSQVPRIDFANCSGARAGAEPEGRGSNTNGTGVFCGGGAPKHRPQTTSTAG